VLERAREGGREGKEGGEVVGDGPWVVPRDSEAWGVWSQRGGRAARRGRQRPSPATGTKTGEGDADERAPA
jgi:hypothetical protein